MGRGSSLHISTVPWESPIPQRPTPYPLTISFMAAVALSLLRHLCSALMVAPSEQVQALEETDLLLMSEGFSPGLVPFGPWGV